MTIFLLGSREPQRALEAPLLMSTGPAPHVGPASGLSDAALVMSARAGERWACEALVRRHTDMAYGLAFRLLARDQDAEDVVQDAFLIVLERLDRLRDPQALAAFLTSVIVNRVRRLIRRRRIARRLGLLPSAEALDVDALVAHDAPPDAAAEIRSIYRVLDALPANARIALVLRRVEGMPLEQVAEALGCSTATAKRRIAAAEAALAQDSPAGLEEARPLLQRSAR